LKAQLAEDEANFALRKEEMAFNTQIEELDAELRRFNNAEAALYATQDTYWSQLDQLDDTDPEDAPAIKALNDQIAYGEQQVAGLQKKAEEVSK